MLQHLAVYMCSGDSISVLYKCKTTLYPLSHLSPLFFLFSLDLCPIMTILLTGVVGLLSVNTLEMSSHKQTIPDTQCVQDTCKLNQVDNKLIITLNMLIMIRS